MDPNYLGPILFSLHCILWVLISLFFIFKHLNKFLFAGHQVYQATITVILS